MNHEEIKWEERDARQAGREKERRGEYEEESSNKRGGDKLNESGAKCFACLDRPQTPSVNLVHQSCKI